MGYVLTTIFYAILFLLNAFFAVVSFDSGFLWVLNLIAAVIVFVSWLAAMSILRQKNRYN